MNNKRQINISKVIIVICVIIYLLYIYFYRLTNDEVSTMILLGTDYKTFTLGLGEYFRLITSGFCHFSILHLVCNMLSLYSLGSLIQSIYGAKKYLIYLFGGILIGSLTSGILNTNVIESGISSGLYTFFIIIILYVFTYHKQLTSNFIPVVFLNFSLNFLPNVSWQAHLGGAIAGVIFFIIEYYNVTGNKMTSMLYKLLLVVVIVGLSFKYYQTKDQIMDYYGTDYRYVSYLDRINPKLRNYYIIKLNKYYELKEDLYE